MPDPGQAPRPVRTKGLPAVTRLYGIRHHGPGSARSLRQALAELEPDVVLIEGPPEADGLVELAGEEEMRPPVALLGYVPGEPKTAAFWPFAVFSPEWQAIRYALGAGVPVRFCDLPAAHQLAMSGRGDPARTDPVSELAAAAGYDDPERWWEDVVEHVPGPAIFARAARMLAALPGSALGRRMAERALRCVRIEPGASGPRLTIALPARGDDSMRRDGIPPGPAGGSPLADRTRLLLELVARTPLPAWTRESGLTAAQLVAVPAGDWAPVLFTGWARAAIAQQDRGWMAALISRAITGRVPGRVAEIEALQRARRAEPALGAPGALPAPPPGAPPFTGAMLGLLRFRYDMLEELENGDSGE